MSNKEVQLPGANLLCAHACRLEALGRSPACCHLSFANQCLVVIHIETTGFRLDLHNLTSFRFVFLT